MGARPHEVGLAYPKLVKRLKKQLTFNEKCTIKGISCPLKNGFLHLSKRRGKDSLAYSHPCHPSSRGCFTAAFDHCERSPMAGERGNLIFSKPYPIASVVLLPRMTSRSNFSRMRRRREDNLKNNHE
jgi:hypothetical protein